MFVVFVEDNSHTMEESERSIYGQYPTSADAIAAAKAIVDRSLNELHEPGMKADRLFRLYQSFGQDAFIVPEDGPERFSAREYVRHRCTELCG